LWIVLFAEVCSHFSLSLSRLNTQMRVALVFACLVGAALAFSGPAASGELSPELIETEGPAVVYPRQQNVCCKQGNDAARKACREERTKPANMTYWSLCVGATGYGCEGVTKEFTIIKDKFKIPITIVKRHLYSPQRFSPHGDLPNPSSSMVGLFASIGAIMHDRCCTTHNDGAFCNDNNTPFLSTANVDLPLMDRLDNNCACLLEWRRAVFDLFNGFGEVMNFPKTPKPDLNAPGKVNRVTSLPGALTLLPVPLRGSQWDKYYHQDIKETVGTNAIKFSVGTKLTCIAAVDKRCGGIKKGAPLTKEQEVAGDASFCKSGKFAKIDYDTDNHGVGYCA